MLRPFATAGIPPAPRINADSLDAPVVTRRQIEEGVATSRFSAAGARLTGNAAARSGMTAIVLGDSYVVAEQVRDQQTMGAVLERIARAEGLPVDVRQYGWHGASGAQYLHVAKSVRRRWNPVRVFVVLSDNDFDHTALTLDQPRLRIARDGQVRLVGAPKDTLSARPSRSVLAALMHRRWHIASGRATRSRAERRRLSGGPSAADSSESAPDSVEIAAVPAAVIRALADAYGQSLVLIYLPTLGLTGDSTATPNEMRFLAACARQRVDCSSARQAMLEARARGRMSHGSTTRKIANGHLNTTGHLLLAREMWPYLRRTPVSLASSRRAVP